MAVCVETAAAELRAVYSSGKTRTYEWRVSQLKAMLKIAIHHEKEFIEALSSDLGKHEHEAFLHEVREFGLFDLLLVIRFGVLMCVLFCDE